MAPRAIITSRGGEVAIRRQSEQTAAAERGGFEFRLLRDCSGQPFRRVAPRLPGSCSPRLDAIREFEPDYLFCPPIPEDPLEGVHVDHLDVAQAIRSVAYLINVPQALTPEYPAPPGPHPFVPTPVILNTYDGYMAGGHGHDLAIDITEVADQVADLAWCHESQLREWLPWIDRHNIAVPSDPLGWRVQFRELDGSTEGGAGNRTSGTYEVFWVTAWGVVPTLERLLAEFPGISPEASRLERLGRRLAGWRAAAGRGRRFMGVGSLANYLEHLDSEMRRGLRAPGGLPHRITLEVPFTVRSTPEAGLVFEPVSEPISSESRATPFIDFGWSGIRRMAVDGRPIRG